MGNSYRLGFSLFELLLALALSALLAGLFLLYFQKVSGYIDTNKNLQALAANLRYAQSLAIADDEMVTVCPFNKQFQCGTDWSKGYQIVLGQVGAREHFSVKRRLSVVEGVMGQLSWQSFPRGSFIFWTSSGDIKQQNGTFKLCPIDNDSRYARALVISKAGRMRFTHMRSDGRTLVCP